MDDSPFETLHAQLKRLRIRRALIVTSTLRGLHGSSLVALDVGRVLASAGVTVDFFTLDCGPPLRNSLAEQGFCCFDPTTNPQGLYGASYDLVWGQHWPAYGFAFLELQIEARYFALVSLSSYEPLESVHTLLPQADILVFNSRSTRDETLACLDVETSKPIGVTGNALPPDWFTTPPKPIANDRPRSIAIISNRRSEEVRQAGRLLATHGIEVRFVGSEDQPCLVDREFVDRFDVIVTIGHTVQKALARARAVYCYDRFGGPGYIDSTNLEIAETYNFSGRDRPVAKSSEQICAEILASYSEIASATNALRRIASERYRLDRVLADLLRRLTVRPTPWSVRRDKRSVERKLVRYGVNIAMKYELFAPESAMSSDDHQDFVRVVRTVRLSEAIPFFREVHDSNPGLFAVSRQPRPIPIHGFILPAPGLEIRSIEAHHDDGGVTTATINLPSPWLKNKFPDHPRGNAGRFNAHLMARAGAQQVELVATLSDGTRAPFFTVGFEPIRAAR
jgi:hypothetical protein